MKSAGEMTRPVRVELSSRDRFWRRAVMVEWEHQFPERAIVAEGGDFYVLEDEWLGDFERIAGRCFSRVVCAPELPSRRRLFRRLLAQES